MSKSLQNFNCIITGGTGELGQTVVAEFIKSGAKVITNYRNKDKFNLLRETVIFPKKLFGIEAELITEESAEQFFQMCKMQIKRLDIFIHLLGGLLDGGGTGGYLTKKLGDYAGSQPQ
jgi:NAD(P)-dependent dehydrogenase (short-subunit alcohol dehydrogenase family)